MNEVAVSRSFQARRKVELLGRLRFRSCSRARFLGQNLAPLFGVCNWKTVERRQKTDRAAVLVLGPLTQRISLVVLAFGSSRRRAPASCAFAQLLDVRGWSQKVLPGSGACDDQPVARVSICHRCAQR